MENAFYLLMVQCAVHWMNADIFAFVARLGAANGTNKNRRGENEEKNKKKKKNKMSQTNNRNAKEKKMKNHKLTVRLKAPACNRVKWTYFSIHKNSRAIVQIANSFEEFVFHFFYAWLPYNGKIFHGLQKHFVFFLLQVNIFVSCEKQMNQIRLIDANSAIRFYFSTANLRKYDHCRIGRH